MVYVKISKKVMIDFLIKNNKIINQKLVDMVFDNIILLEELNFEPFEDLKKKIKSCLISLKNSYERVQRRSRGGIKLKLFLSTSSKEFIEFPLKPKSLLKPQDITHVNQVEILMNNLEIKSDNIEVLFDNMNI